MSFHGAAQFAQMRSDLTTLLIATASLYCNNLGLPKFKSASLVQMSTPVDTIAGEMLMFGADTWPEYAKGSEDYGELTALLAS